MSETPKLARLRSWWEAWGHIDTAGGLPAWYTWSKTGFSGAVSGVTVYFAIIEDVPVTYAIPAAIATFGAMLWVWNQFYARSLQKQKAALNAVREGTPTAITPLRALERFYIALASLREHAERIVWLIKEGGQPKGLTDVGLAVERIRSEIMNLAHRF